MSNKSAFMEAGLGLLAAGKTVCVDLDSDQYAPEPEPKEDTPPRKISSDIRSADYHPCCLRIGLKINGEVKNNVIAYDMDRGVVSYQGGLVVNADTIEPFWRYPETRQQRRARESWEKKHV